MASQQDFGNKVQNGFFEISFQKDGIYLKVYPAVGSGSKVRVDDVLDKLSKKRVRNLDRHAIEVAVANAAKIPQRIADAQEEVKLDASVLMNVTPDKMRAYMIVYPPEGGRMLNHQELMQKVNDSGVVYGLKMNVIEQLAKNPVYNEQILIAEGTMPQNGTNGKNEFTFDIKKDARPTINPDGTVNFRELNIIQNVNKGEVLVTTTQPTPGMPGRTVVGVDIPAINGKPAVLPRGKNVEISPDGASLIAAISGLVNYIDGKVSVFALYEVPADVDNSTGNISFVGNVLVHGNVLSGFTIEAGGNVEVFGVVEGATIRSGGNIVLRRGMQGLGKGTLVAEGDIVARYIEHSNIQARGDIKSEAIMHSNVKCGGRLELSGRKGLLVGGTAKVGKEISAKVIGSPMATVTEIEVGIDPGMRERYKAVKDEITLAESDIKKAEQAIEILRKLEKIGKLPIEKQAILEKSIRTKEYYSGNLLELRQELEQLDEKLEQESLGRILAQSVIYPGTKIAIGTSFMNVRENLQFCSLFRDGADIRVGGYK